MSTPPAPAGWYLDPSDSSRERWWDGTGWGEQSRPFVGAPPPAVAPAPQPPPPPPPLHPPGWYPDSQGTTRYWDGRGWTEHVAAQARRPPAFWCAIAAAGLMVLGGLGPWATALRVVDVSGTHGDGWLVIAAAIVATITLFASRGRAGPIVALLAGVGGALVGFVDLSNINSRGGFVRPAWGIYMVILSSATLFVASLILLFQKRRP